MIRTKSGIAMKVAPDVEAIGSLLAARGIDVDPAVAASRYVRYIASEESTDTMGDVILASAWDVREWLDNPAMFADHSNRTGSVVARGLNAQIIGKQLVVDAFFLPPELDPTKGTAETLYKMVNAGILTDCSVGFFPKAKGYRWATDADRATYGKECGMIYTGVALKELSVVGVGAHPSAKVEAVAKGLRDGSLTESDIRSMKTLGMDDMIERALFRISPKTISVPEPSANADILDAIAKMGKDLSVMKRMQRKEGQLGIFLPLEAAQNIATWIEAIEDTLSEYMPDPDENEEDDENPAASNPVTPPYEEPGSVSAETLSALKALALLTSTTTGA
jgi:HK97 family phage prohead protease